jgi:phosphatidylglycerol:prolipoprotein diacylglycerol transferase
MTLDLGPFSISLYGIILMSGAVLGAWLATRQARYWGEDPEIVWDSFTWILIGGIVGARLWHIFTPSPSLIATDRTTMFYLTHPLDALAIWKGGLGLPGAVIGGILALYWVARKRGLNFALWVDMVAPAAALGQAIGRWGNFVNQELYGLPTDLPWGIFIESAYRVPGYESFTHFHPLFLYESLWNLANMALLLWLGYRFANRLRDGDIFLTYLIVYPIGRFLLEFIRLDSSEIASINANQSFMAGVFVLAGLALFMRHRKTFVSKETIREQKISSNLIETE